MVDRLRSLLLRRTTAYLVGVLAIMIVSKILFPIPLPTILLPAEKIPLPSGGYLNLAGFELSNSMLATLLADVFILLIVIATRLGLKMVPGGFANLIEWLIETFYNLCKDVAGRYADKFFPLVMTLFIFILVANWSHFIPGFDSIGMVEHPHGFAVEAQSYEIDCLGSLAVITSRVFDAHAPDAAEQAKKRCSAPVTAIENRAEEEEEAHLTGYILVPFLRAAATDLNVPLAMSLVTIVFVQIVGFQTLGVGYLKKFFDFSGAIPAFVGILELISEISRILSFAFRLFGNIFAGQVLLFVIPFLLSWLAVLPFYGLELFVGAIQAFVFAMLALVFLSMATISHGAHEEEHGEEGHTTTPREQIEAAGVGH